MKHKEEEMDWTMRGLLVILCALAFAAAAAGDPAKGLI